MEKLIFSCNWGRNPEKAWSGTSMGLYRELEKHFTMEQLNIDCRIPLLLPLRCMEKLGIGRFDMVYMKYYNKVFQRRYSGEKDIKVFQFDECPDGRKNTSYIFQDLSAGFLLDVFYHHPELVPYCGMENLDKKYLEKRVRQQNEFYQRAAGIFTMGQWLADYLVENNDIQREKVHAVGGGINVDSAKIDDTHKTGNKLLYVGRDFERKGGDLVVRAFLELKKRNPEAELYIAGPEKNPVADMMQEGIFFLGEQNREQLNMLYNKCDIFCMPSRFEAYGLVFSEALAFGLPCIGRNAFSMKEFIQEGQNGYLIQSDDIQELTDKMELALKNCKMKDYVKSHREQYLQEYSWSKVAERIVTVINRMQ